MEGASKNNTSTTQSSHFVSENEKVDLEIVMVNPDIAVINTPSAHAPTPTLVTPQSTTTPGPDGLNAPDPSAPDQNADTTSVGGKRNRSGHTSSVWDHYDRIKLASGETCKNFSQCKYCKEKVRCHSRRNGTSSLWNHGRTCKLSPLFIKEDPKQKTLSKDNVTGAAILHQFNQKNCDQKLYEMVVRDELPFRFVEGGGFRDFVFELQPRYKIPGRRAVAAGILARYQLEKAKMLKHFANNDIRVSITTDCWTSVQNINYLVLTAHFMDDEFKLHKRIINFCVITSHKGEDIGRVLESCLRGWGISNIFTITVDNASANDVAVGYMKKRLRSYKTLMFGGDFLHCRCVCHIINLIVKDGIKELEASIAKIWNCVKYIRSSASRLAKFREFSVLENLRGNANVPLDVVTRWNSTYLMLDAALKYESVFTRMGEEDQPFQSYFDEVDRNGNKRQGPPEFEDWRDAEAFALFLKKFYDTTVKLSAWKSVTSNLVFDLMIDMQCEIDAQMLSYDPIMRKVAISMKAKFDKYWGSFDKVNKIVIIANVLDPRFKLHCVYVGLEQVGNNEEMIDSIGCEVKQILMRMYESYRITAVGSRQMGNGVEDVDQNRVDVQQGEGKSRILRAIKERLGDTNHTVSNEVEQYLTDKLVVVPGGSFDIAAWWKQNAYTYPILAKIARDVVAVPCSTVASENAFSLGSRIVDPFRASLTPKMVEALVCCSDWLKGEEFNFYKEPTVDELDLYQTLEQLEIEENAMQGLQANIPTVAAAVSASVGTTSASASTPNSQGEQAASAPPETQWASL